MFAMIPHAPALLPIPHVSRTFPRRVAHPSPACPILRNMLNKAFEKHREYGMFFVRLIVGFHLVYGAADNVFSWHDMLRFRDFLAANGTPFPLLGAIISAWAMFLCGILYILGAFTRYAAAIMILNFLAALAIAHRTGGYPPAALALVMLFCSIALLLHGAGKPSMDERARPRT
jgi:putative oxidoreductase